MVAFFAHLLHAPRRRRVQCLDEKLLDASKLNTTSTLVLAFVCRSARLVGQALGPAAAAVVERGKSALPVGCGTVRCGPCGRGEAHPERERHDQMNLFMSRLDEGQRRRYLALESQRLSWGADRLLMEITGVDEQTIKKSR